MPNQSDQNQSNTTPVIPDFQADVPPIPTDTSNVSTQPQSAAPAQSEPDAPVEIGSSTPPETPSIISTSPKKKFGGGKIIATILGFLILVGGIAGGVILTQQQQDIRERAGTCVDPSCTIILDPTGSYQDTNPNDETYIDEEGDYVENGQNQGSAVDLQSDEKNCGVIGKKCLSGENCSGGSCTSTTVSGGNSCTGTGSCTSGGFSGTCINGACISSSVACKIGDPNAPGCCANLNEADCEDVVCENGPTGARTECKIGSLGQHCTLSVGGGGSCGEGGTTTNEVDNPTPTPTPTISGQCSAVLAYNADVYSPTALTQQELSALEPGTNIRFCVGGSIVASPPSSFDKAQFMINGVLLPETSAPNPFGPKSVGHEQYCQTYELKETDTTVTVKAKIHHPTLGWKGENI